MQLTSRGLSFVLLSSMGLVLTVSPGYCATVMVNAAGGADYTTIAAAVAAFGTWSNGTADTILLTDDAVHPAEASVSLPGGATLAIRNNPGDVPAIEVSTGIDFLLGHGGGTFTLEGLTFMGNNDNGSPGDGCRAFRADPGAPLTLTVRNCTFTKNNGSDVPFTDWTAGAQPFEPGVLGQSLRLRDNAPITVVVEDCVFAYQADGGAITMDGTGFNANSSITVRNSLFLHGREMLFRANNFVHPDLPITIQNCLFVHSGGNRAFLFGHEGLAADITIEDTVVVMQSSEQAIGTSDGGFSGTLHINRDTFFGPSYGTDFIAVNGVFEGNEPTIDLDDVVFAQSGDSILRMTDFFGEPAAANHVTAANVAAFGVPPYRADQHATLKAVFDGLYGGSGPLTADPAFASVDVAAALTAGQTTWDSTTNTLLDVGSAEYCGKGSGGTNLSGGAETVAGACEISSVESWAQY